MIIELSTRSSSLDVTTNQPYSATNLKRRLKTMSYGLLEISEEVKITKLDLLYSMEVMRYTRVS